VPRSHFSLLRIFISPFLHVNRKHLAANSIPFFILGGLAMIQGQAVFWLSTVIIIIVAGLGIYFFAKSGTIHMGASGLILGYFGYLLANVFFNPEIVTIIIAAIVVVLYLGLITQIVPLKNGVSTTGHLFGFIGGILAAAITSVF
jgi:membrane associated rhomboid family serine protease